MAKSFEAWRAHLRRKHGLIQEHRAAIAQAKADRADLEQRYTTALVEGGNTSQLEKALSAIDAKIDRHERILENLVNYQDDGHAEQLVVAALGENRDRLLARDAEMAAIISDIEKANEAIWALIEKYLAARDEAWQDIHRREQVENDIAGEPFAQRMKRVGLTGQLERLHLKALPLIDLAAIRDRFGKLSR